MNETQSYRLRAGSHDLEVWVDDEHDEILVGCQVDGAKIVGAGDGYFAALRALRLQLEPLGLLLECYGASLTHYPTGLAASMGGGGLCYSLVPGRRPTDAHLVDVFATGPDCTPASVSDQERWFETWCSTPLAD